MRYRYFFLVAVASVYLLLTGCGGSSSGGRSPVEKDASWTVLVYLNADNDLEPYGSLNLNQMEEVGSSDNVKIVVQMDRSPGYDTSNSNWTGTRRYLVTKDNDENIINSSLLQDMGEVDMGNPDTLRDFIRWGQENYPANHYCLVIWNHGSGWRSTNSLDTISRNVSFDDTTGTSIKTTDLPYALSAAYPQFDLVAFDASLMQMLEVAYEMRNSAGTLVGSEESPPGEGYTYDKWLSKLAASPGMNARELGTVISQEYIKSYTNLKSVTQSVIDLSKVEGVASATNDLAAVLSTHVASNASSLRVARRSSQSYAYDFYKDLLDYATLVNQMVPDEAITSAKSRLESAMSSAIVYEAHTGSRVARSRGLSIYVPEAGNYINGYDSLSFTRDYPNWAAFIKAQQE